jgi:hypothetical protein
MPHTNAQSLNLNGELLAELEEPEILLHRLAVLRSLRCL